MQIKFRTIELRNMSSPAPKLKCQDCQIRHRAVCSRCVDEELMRLDAIKFYRSYKAGETIVFTGDEMEFVASVVTGVATLTQTMEDGRTQMVGLMLPSDFVGRPGRKSVIYDIVAATDMVLCCFHKKPFEGLLEETPHISTRLLQMTLDELDAAREWMLVLGRKTAREKIASLLLILARRHAALALKGGSKEIAFDLSLKREAMADYLGLTLETVSRQISNLKRDGVIKIEGRRSISIPDMDRLTEESGDDIDGSLLV